MSTSDEQNVVMERRRGGDRRKATEDRRKRNEPVAVDRRKGQRRKVQRRRQIDPTTCERDYTAEEIEFMQALDAYKRRAGRMFPTCSEILEVIRSLGYVRAAELQGQSAEKAETAEGAEPAAEARAARPGPGQVAE